MRRLGLVLGALALAATGCGGGTSSHDAAAPASPTATASPTHATASASTAACTVKGYYPKTRKTLDRVHPVVLYGARIGLPPAGSANGGGALRPDEPTPHLGVRVTTPGDAVITPGLKKSVAATVSGASVRVLPASVHAQWKLPQGKGNRQYLVYAGATLYQGTWSAKICGEGMNDGSKVVTYSGTFTVLGHLHRGVALCGETPHGSALNKRAIKRACM
ncbi:MAG TPA: hypothetical protein VF426_08700 [Marmoricola sp.]